jgi:uncharacterized damage-inducible protein DinB
VSQESTLTNDPIGPIQLAPDPGRNQADRDNLVTFLEYFRSVLIRKAAGLESSQLAAMLAPSSLTIGGLIKHMAFVEDHWFGYVLLGEEYPEPWASADWNSSPDWEFDTAPNDSPAELLAQYERSVERSRQALDVVDDLDAIAVRSPHDRPTNVRWVLVHLIEEYARHCGHADLIRESIDGRTGD